MNADSGFPQRPTTPDVDRTPRGDRGFADRLMASIEREPAPTPTRNLISAVRARSAGDAASALWAAWHLGTVRSWRIAPVVRVRSFALVLAVACVLGTGSIAAAAALRVAAEPVANMFQSGVDEQGPVENSAPDVDQQHQSGQGDQPGADQPNVDQQQQGDDPGGDQPGANQPGGDQGQGDQPDADQPGGDEGQGDQPGADQPGGDEGPNGDQSEGGDRTGGDQDGDQPGAGQPGSGNAGGSDSGEGSGANGSDEGGNSNDGNSNN